MKAAANLIARIMGRIHFEPNSGCWLWEGARDSKGYGNVCVAYGKKPQNNKIRKVYAVLFEHFKGEYPKHMHLDHKCRNPSCCNPEHMEVVTKYENWSRGCVAVANNGFRAKFI